MAMSNAERQKRWKAKHRALYNLQRRNKRKNLAESPSDELGRCRVAPERLPDKPAQTSSGSVDDQTSKLVTSVDPGIPQTSKETKLDMLRGLIKAEQEKSPTEVPAAPVKLPQRFIFGRPATEEEWQKKLELDRIADEKGYQRDEFSQA